MVIKGIWAGSMRGGYIEPRPESWGAQHVQETPLSQQHNHAKGSSKNRKIGLSNNKIGFSN